MLPTFLIAGAGKAGTTSLYSYAAQHPHVDVSVVKEPWFFTQDIRDNHGSGLTSMAFTGNWSLGIDWYESLYSHAAAHNARGEASPYMARQDAPELIHQVLPEVRLVFILRHPVERLISHYWQDRKMARRLPPLDDGVAHRHPIVVNQISESGYRTHLERFFHVFESEQVLILLFEDLLAHPYAVMSSMFHHIGVDPSFEPTEATRSHNPRAAPRLRKLHRAGRPVARALEASPLPNRAKRMVVRAGRAMTSANLAPPNKTPMSPHIRERLLERFEPDTSYVEALLERELPQWRR